MAFQTKDTQTGTVSKCISLRVLKKGATNDNGAKVEITPNILNSEAKLSAERAKKLVDYFNSYSDDPQLSEKLEKVIKLTVPNESKEGSNSETKTVNGMWFLYQTLKITEFDENTSYADGMLAYLILSAAYDEVIEDENALSELTLIFGSNKPVDLTTNDALLAYHRNEVVNYYNKLGNDERERRVMACVMFNDISDDQANVLEHAHMAILSSKNKEDRDTILLGEPDAQTWIDIEQKLCDVNSLSTLAKFPLKVRQMKSMMTNKLDFTMNSISYAVLGLNNPWVIDHDPPSLQGKLMCESVTYALERNQPEEAIDTIRRELSELLVNLGMDEKSKESETYVNLTSAVNDSISRINARSKNSGLKEVADSMANNLNSLKIDFGTPEARMLNNISSAINVVSLYFDILEQQKELTVLAQEVKRLGNEIRSSKRDVPADKRYIEKISTFLESLEEETLLQFRTYNAGVIEKLEDESYDAEKDADEYLHKTARQLIMQMHNELLRTTTSGTAAFA